MFNLYPVSNTPPPKKDDPDDINNQNRRNPPPDDSFKKLTRPPSKGDTERASALKDKKEPSLFDLSRNKPKGRANASGEKSDETGEKPALSRKENSEKMEEEGGIEKEEARAEEELAAEEVEIKEDPTFEENEKLEKEGRADAPVFSRKTSDSDKEGGGEFHDQKNNPLLNAGIKNGDKADLKKGMDPLLGEGIEDAFELPPEVRQLLKEITPPPKETSVDKQAQLRANASEMMQNEKGVETKETSSSKTKTETGRKEGISKASEKKEDGSMQVHAPIDGVGLGTNKMTVIEDENTKTQTTIKDIATKLVDAIQVMKKEGLTETMITLKNPALLAGTTITLTEFDHAKGEFNIRFANLSPQAKVFLDQQLAADPLNRHLENKGIVIHVVTTSTEPEKILSSETPESANKEREQSKEEQKKEQQSEQQETESEF